MSMTDCKDLCTRLRVFGRISARIPGNVKKHNLTLSNSQPFFAFLAVSFQSHHSCSFVSAMATAEFTERLIHLVKQHRILYDKLCSDYRDTEHKERLWLHIADQLGTQNVKAVKDKWRNLKDTYVKERRREPKGRTGLRGRKKKKWKHFDSMSFLSSTTANRRSDDNIQGGDDDKKEELKNGTEEGGSTQTKKENSSGEGSSSSSTPPGSGGAKRQRQAENVDSLERYLQRQQSQTWQDLLTDEVSTFLNSLAPTMRRLPPEKMSMLKIKMLELVHEAAFGKSNV